MRSPGHSQFPDHMVQTQPVGQRVTVHLGNDIAADSIEVLRVVEDGHPVRYYFSRDDVAMSRLRPSERTAQCPFKGVARYYDLALGGQKLKDVAWSYEDPYDEHRDIKGRLAFFVEKVPGLAIEVGR